MILGSSPEKNEEMMRRASECGDLLDEYLVHLEPFVVHDEFGAGLYPRSQCPGIVSTYWTFIKGARFRLAEGHMQ